MKKAQILSALALAFALGVAIIPTASTYAQVVTTVNGIEVTDDATERKVQEAITAGKDSCGWHLVNNVKTFYYEQYESLINRLDISAKNVEDKEKSLYNDLKTIYANTLTTFKGVMDTANVKLPVGLETEFSSSVKTYSDAVKFINSMVSILRTNATKFRDNADTTIYDAYQTAINTFSGDNATTNKLLDAENSLDAVKDTEAGAIEDVIVLITEEDKDTDITYADAVKKANNLKSTENGTCTIAKVTNLKKAIDYAQQMLDSTDNFTVADADKAIANITKAMNGGTVTDSDVNNGTGEGTNKEDDEKTDLTSPDTGVLNAEGNATTTVAMVAGVATALTAAGAGVVAYRNARRSTRK